MKPYIDIRDHFIYICIFIKHGTITIKSNNKKKTGRTHKNHDKILVVCEYGKILKMSLHANVY